MQCQQSAGTVSSVDPSAPPRMIDHPLYDRWRGMKTRCNNPNHEAYHRYGGRGIKMCGRWYSFAAYVDDINSILGPQPGPEYSIDRIDNDGDYTPTNVRWATQRVQSQNQGRREDAYLFLRGQSWYFKMAVPCELRGRPPYVTSSGKSKTHVVEALHTKDRQVARERLAPIVAYWQGRFEREVRGLSCAISVPLKGSENCAIDQEREGGDQVRFDRVVPNGTPV
jgi:hypothetical protein